ncbi:MAG: 5'/3'-nucleotidase SurE [Campylobacteraceae bacterium]|nr:5'/3'-nucleotidase SurE [Campylobacteraceae bacterium]
MKKQILITNDDGYESPGLHALVDALRPLGRVTVVAPTTEKSACGHSLTLTRPLRFVQVSDDFFKLDDGTPTDCIYLALNALFYENKMPDLIVSGINLGANMGEDITYSGTAGAAMEGVLQGVPSIAFSQVFEKGEENLSTFNFALAKRTAYDLVKRVFEKGFPLKDRQFLNVNIPYLPPALCNGIRTTCFGRREYGNEAHLHRNPRGLEYYWIGAPSLGWEANKDNGCDLSAIKDGYVSITPALLDLSAYRSLSKVNDWLE